MQELSLKVSPSLVPLQWPPGFPPTPTPDEYDMEPQSRFERIFWRVPYIGWILRCRRFNKEIVTPTTDYINNQLRQRPEIKVQGESSELFLTICKMIKRELRWVNSRYIPADPLSILLYSHVDGLDAAAFIIDLEDEVDMNLPDEVELIDLYPQLGDLVRMVTSKED